MNDPNERLNEQQTESGFGQSDAEAEFELKAGFVPHGVTGGKGPGFVSENETE